MDLLSAARRLSSPFVFERPMAQLPIGQRGLIGDGNTCALVRVDGAIDWLCLPRFDSPSVFGALLDPERGGMTAIRPTAPFESLQRYDPDTNVLETVFKVEGQGVVRLTDLMPWTDDPRSGIQEVHRRMSCAEGAVELEVVFDPRFDYGRAETSIEIGEHGVMARAEGRSLAAVVGNGVRWEARDAGGVACRFTLRSGQSRWMILSGDAPSPEPVAAYRPWEHLRATRLRWREWAHGVTYDGPSRHHVLRSALLLKLLMYAPTGAMVAAPTTSLPEWIGGTRNWDYRYTWTRDAAMAVRAANLVGCEREARDFFHFMRDALSHEPTLQVMYTIDGEPVPAEEELAHLSGFEGSGPVRIGNGARHQLQYDISGALVDAAHLYEHFGGSLTLGAWRRLRSVIEQVEAHWSQPDHGIWEPRHGTRHNVHSKLMCWLALERGSHIAQLFGDDAAAARWATEATRVKADVEKRGLAEGGGHYTAAYGETHPDAALLLLPTLGFGEPDDPRIRGTIDRIRAELADGPYLHRYRVDDGIGEPEGAFVLCGFWLAEALALDGRLDEAQEVFTAHAEKASNHLGLIAEEVDPKTHAPLGNFPQAFSHLGLINAALRIDRGLTMRDEGDPSPPSLVGQTSPRIGGAP